MHAIICNLNFKNIDRETRLPNLNIYTLNQVLEIRDFKQRKYKIKEKEMVIKKYGSVDMCKFVNYSIWHACLRKQSTVTADQCILEGC